MSESHPPEIQEIGKTGRFSVEKFSKKIEDKRSKGEQIEEQEIEQTPELKELISKANLAIVEHLTKYEVKAFEVPSSNRVHFIEVSIFDDDKGAWDTASGYYFSEERAIYIGQLTTDDIDLYEDNELTELKNNSDSPLWIIDELADEKFGKNNKANEEYIDAGFPDLSDYILDTDDEQTREAKTRAYEKEKFIDEALAQNKINARTAFTRWKNRRLCHTYIHEAYHYASKNKLLLKGSTEGSRSGYSIWFESGIEQWIISFESLNEAITEMLAMETLINNEQKLGINSQEFITHDGIVKNFEEEFEEELENYYTKDRALLLTIINQISKATDQKPEIIWRRLVQGYVSGEMMHLRDIEKVYGQGGLRFYASLPAMYKLSPELQEKLLVFFEQPNTGDIEALTKLVVEEGKSYAEKDKVE